MDSWTLPEKIHLLELFTKNELWENRAAEMDRLFGSKHSPGFFTVKSCKDELHHIFSRPNPEHVNGLPAHPRSKEAAEMWLKFYAEEMKNERQKSRQMFWVGMRGILDSIQKFKTGKYNANYWIELREQYRNTNKNDDLLNRCVETFMNKAQSTDLKNVSSTDDLLQLIRGEHVMERATPSPAKSSKNVSPRILSPLTSPTVSNNSSLVHKAVSSKKSSESMESMDVDYQKKELAESVTKNIQDPTPSSSQTRLRRTTANAKAGANQIPYNPKEVVSSTNALVKGEHVMERATPSPAKSSKNVLPVKSSLESSETTDSTPSPSQTRLRRTTANAKAGGNRVPFNLKEVVSATDDLVKGEHIMEPATPSSAKSSKNVSPSKSSLESMEIDSAPSPSQTRLRRTITNAKAGGNRILNNPKELVSSTDDLVKSEHITERATPSPAKSSKNVSPVKSSLESSETTDSAPSLSQTRLRRTTANVKSGGNQILYNPKEVVSATDDLVKGEHVMEQPSSAPAKLSKIVLPEKTNLEFLKTTDPAPSLSQTRLRRTTANAKAGGNRIRYNSKEVVSRATLLSVWKEICSHRAAGVFYDPVVEAEVPGYHSAVKRPINLSTIKKMIESGAIETFGEFTSAVVLLFANAVMFNSTDHDVNIAAKELLEQSMHYIMDAQYPCGEFGDIVTASSFPGGSSSRRVSKSIQGSTEDVS